MKRTQEEILATFPVLAGLPENTQKWVESLEKHSASHPRSRHLTFYKESVISILLHRSAVTEKETLIVLTDVSVYGGSGGIEGRNVVYALGSPGGELAGTCKHSREYPWLTHVYRSAHGSGMGELLLEVVDFCPLTKEGRSCVLFRALSEKRMVLYPRIGLYLFGDQAFPEEVPSSPRKVEPEYELVML
ncbi:MAG TPA: hypothetical protein VLA04_05370 [Verrucomicrobiae bacterium]|nr:hypothetical protein [Verrucomicrobiae bacterium]